MTFPCEDAPFPTALPAAEGNVFQLSDELLEHGCEMARRSPRGRIIFPIHRRQEARVQRMLNFMQPGTCVRPHRHPLDHATESIQVLRGDLGCLVFDENGGIASTHRLRACDSVAFLDIEPGIWHGMVVLEPDTVVLEFKQGPYDAKTDKEFAAWAPEEGETAATACVEGWQRLFD